MGSHCHHPHHHCFASPPAAASSCYCCCGCSCSCGPPQPPPATTAADPLILQAIAAQLLQSPPPPIYSNQYLQSLHYLYPNPSPPPPPAEHQRHQFHHKQTTQHPHRKKDQQHQGHNDLVESLLQRISALESTLPQPRSHTAHVADAAQIAVPHLAESPRRDSAPRSTPPRRVASSVRDAAARTIQAQFRLYLIRRSQALRDLKQLATIRSEVAALKSSFRYDSPHPHLEDLKAVQSRALDLLEKLDYIQSSDPMIREGKRSIRLELIGISELADGVVNRLISERFEELHMQQFSKPATRRVTFADSCNEGDSRASEEDLDVEGDEEEKGNATFNDDSENYHRLKKLVKSDDGKSSLHAPLPVQMESRKNDGSDSTNGNQ